MAELIFSEQEIVNAICVDTAQKQSIAPEEVEVELLYEDEEGFSADVYVKGRKQLLSSFDIIQAIRFWLAEVLQQDPYAAGIHLVLDDEEGIIAKIR